MDKFLVRLLPIISNIYIIVTVILCWNGIDLSILDYCFSTSLLFGILLTVLCHVQGKYHCRWMRFLCYDLVVIPLLSLVDSLFPLFYIVEDYLMSISVIILFSVSATMVMAVRHFLKVRTLNKIRYEQLKPVRPVNSRKSQ